LLKGRLVLVLYVVLALGKSKYIEEEDQGELTLAKLPDNVLRSKTPHWEVGVRPGGFLTGPMNGQGKELKLDTLDI
jgi:hypothetical protein